MNSFRKRRAAHALAFLGVDANGRMSALENALEVEVCANCGKFGANRAQFMTLAQHVTLCGTCYRTVLLEYHITKYGGSVSSWLTKPWEDWLNTRFAYYKNVSK